jgi:hypothetical protein
MAVTMSMNEDELRELIDDKCYENLDINKEPEIQTIVFITLDGKRMDISNIKEVEIVYEA